MGTWTAVGDALSFGAGDVYGVSLSADGYGGFRAFWTQSNGDASGSAVFARHYGSDLTAGADLLINTSTAGDQTAGAVISLSDGSAAYVWADASGVEDSGLGIKTKWFYSDTTTSWEIRVNPGIAGDQVAPVTASLYGGIYHAIGWTDRGATSGAGVRVVFYDDRTRIGNLVSLGAANLPVDQLDLTSDYDRLIATWRERTSASDVGGTIRAQYVNQYTTIGDAFTIGIGTGNAHTVLLADGRIAAVWDVIEGNGSAGVRARIFHADGTPWGAEFAVNPKEGGQQSDAAVVALAAGGFAVFWTDRTGGQDDVVGQTFDNGGMRYGEEMRIGGAGDQYDAVATTLTNGELLVSWTDRGADGDRDLLAQRFAVEAAPAPEGTAAADTLTGSALDDVIDGLAGNDVIVGSSGNDRLSGGEGDDRLVGGQGDDVLLGGEGNDTLIEEPYSYARFGLSTDLLDGGAGDDVIAVTRNNDPALDVVTIIGGAGNDELSFHGAGSTLTIDAGEGDDVVRLYLNNADAVVTLGAGRDLIRLEDYFPDYFREPTLRITDFTPGAGGDRMNLSEIVGANAFTRGQLVLRQVGDDVALAGTASGSSIVVTVAVFEDTRIEQFTSYNFSGMALPEVVTVGPGAVYENSAALIGLPAVRVTGDGAVLRNLAGGSIEKARESGNDPGAAAIVITGADATIENAAGAQIRGPGGSFQAILGSEHDDTVRNAGVINGWVRLAAGDDVYEESGRASNGYNRFVDLGAGDDRASFDLRTMRDDFILSVTGGAGEDRVELNNIGKSQQIRFNGVEGVETIALSGVAGAQVSLSNFRELTGTLEIGAGLVVTAQPYNGAQTYTGVASGTVRLNGGTFSYGPAHAFDRIIGSDAAERVATQAQIFPSSTRATATNSVDLGGGDDTFVFYYGNTAPLSVEGGAGRDTLYASTFYLNLDLSAFHGFETIDVALAIGHSIPDPFVLTGVAADAELLRISGYPRENALLLDLGMRDGLVLELIEQKAIVGMGTTIAKVVGGEGAQAIENRGAILGDVVLGAGADLFANSGTVGGVVRGGAGDDTYIVDAAFRMIEAAGGGTDQVIASIDYRLGNNVENLTLVGEAGLRGTGNALANVITGSAGDDILSGLAGNDTLIGGAGRDVLNGGAGEDLFVFAPGDSAAKAGLADRVGDFSQRQGDRIDLSAFGGLAFVGSEAFSAAGQVRFEIAPGATFVMGDVDGDGRADFQIRLSGEVALTVGDFVL